MVELFMFLAMTAVLFVVFIAASVITTIVVALIALRRNRSPLQAVADFWASII